LLVAVCGTVEGLSHGFGGTREEGVDVVDLGVHLRDGNVVELGCQCDRSFTEKKSLDVPKVGSIQT
jgi:hypothetical protein